MGLAEDMQKVLAPYLAELSALQAENEVLREYMPKTENVNNIPGRRMFFTLRGQQTITTANDGLRGQPMFMSVGQDGPFVMTSYPVIMWKPTASEATPLAVGKWRPIASWPLPDQVSTTNTMDVSYEITDVGPGRNMQGGNASNQVTVPVPVVPSLISRPNNVLPLPLPQVFDANTVIQCVLTFNDMNWTTLTSAQVRVELPGYKIINR